MRIRTTVVLVLILLAVPAGAADRATWGLITGMDVNVRSGSAKAYRDMGKLAKGELVRLLGVSKDGKWLRIVPPEHADVWIFAKFVDVDGERGVLNADKVRVRVRPGLKGELVNQLNRGAILKVKGRDGAWLKIAPPGGTVAWVHAQFVKRMTDEEAAALQAKKASEKAEAEQARAEAAHKLGEAKLVDEADKLFAAELDKDIQARSLGEVLKAYENARKQVSDIELRNRMLVKLAILWDMRSVQAAIVKKAPPGPLSDFDFEEAKKVYGVHREVDDLYAAHKLAQEVAKEAEREAARRREGETELDGWISYLAPGLRHTGATHRITKDRRVLALVKSDRIDFDAFIGTRVRITGKVSGEVRLAADTAAAPVVDVARLEPAFE